MSEYLIQDTTLTAIGDAIRAKTGNTELIAPENMPTEIENIQSGSSELADAYYAMLSCLTTVKFQNSTELEWVPPIDTSKITNFSQIFSECKNLKRIDFINASNGTSFSSMFYGCTSLTTIPQLDTSKGTNFTYMFQLCASLTSVPQLDTSKGTSFSLMFQGCTSLTSVPQLDVSNGTEFIKMFSSCASLTSVPQLDTSNGTSFANMFSYCPKLANISFVNNSIKYSIPFAQSPLLSDESIQSIIDGLAMVDTAQTLTLHADVKAKLTESQIAQITSKNWNLA